MRNECKDLRRDRYSNPEYGMRGRNRKASARISRLTLSVFYHSTEDPDRVMKALLNLVPQSLRNSVQVVKSVVQGHYGDTIGILMMSAKGRRAGEILKHIICSLDDIDRKILLATVANRAGAKPSHLHIRVSKQEAYIGHVELMDGDDVIKVSATVMGVKSVKDLEDFLRTLVGECVEIRGHSS